jgi:hypothetical protein
MGHKRQFPSLDLNGQKLVLFHEREGEIVQVQRLFRKLIEGRKGDPKILAHPLTKLSLIKELRLDQ